MILYRQLSRRLLLTRGFRIRYISSNNSNKKDIDDKLINQWKEGIQKREELKKTMANEERTKFIEAKKKQLEESQVSSERLEKLVEDEKTHDDVIGQVELQLKKEPSNNVNVTGSYQQLVKKIKENENFQELREELKKYNDNPQELKSIREDLSQRLKNNAEELKNAFPIVLKIINELTGYTKVENLKQDILLKESAKNELKQQLALAKTNYNKSIELRSMSQKQINELLQRQNSWSLEDLERFTELYKNDHNLEKQEQENFKLLQDLEFKKDENDDKLTTSILTRYHEEQIWSDKIRKFSTWGTILIMGVNLFLFVIVQLVFEPFKRRRLVNAFEIKVKDLLETNKDAPLIESVEQEQKLIREVTEIEKIISPEVEVSFKFPSFDRSNIKGFFYLLFEDLGTNLEKLFGPSTSSKLVIDKLQLNILLGLGLILSFSIGLLF